jgi:putative transcriptional regulator
MKTILREMWWVLLLGACLAHAQDLSKPLLLVASPDLHGMYGRTALLVIPQGDRHMGFILNRSTEVKLGALFPEHEPSAKVADPLYFGGPEMVESLFAVVRRNPGTSSVRLFGDLFVTADAATVDRIIEQTPNEARYFAGFVGWQPGELSKEVGAGYWYVTDADAALMFSHDTATMWEQLVERLGNGHAPRKDLRQTRLTPSSELAPLAAR